MKRGTLVLVSVAFLAGIVSGGFLSSPLQAQSRRTSETTDLMRVDLGAWCEGKEATVQLLEFGVGASGRHFHPAHSFAYILEGTETQQTEGRGLVTANAGDVLYDSPGEIHETTTPAPARAVIFRIIEKGKETNTYVP